MDAVKKGVLQLCVCACRRRKNEWVFKFSYVINASSIIIEYVSKCLARHHISVKSVKSVREKALSSHGHTDFHAGCNSFQVPRKAPHIREIRERKKHSAVMVTQIAQFTQIFMLAATHSKCLARHHIREIREIRERKSTQQSWSHRLPRSHRFSCCWLLQLGVSALP